MNNNNDLFENAPVGKAVAKMAIPTIISMLVVVIYNMADTFFIGQTGDAMQVAAVSISAPVFTIMMAFGNLFGIGGSSAIARALGAKNHDRAKNISSFCCYVSVGLGVLIMMICLIGMNGILHMIGASENTYEFARQYITIIACSGPFIIFSFAFGNILRGEGAAKQSMIGNMIGTITNIVLDPLLILVFDIGVFGAALATMIGNICACLYYVNFFMRKKSILSISIKNFAANDGIVADVFKIGVPASLNNVLMSTAQVVLNNALIQYGDHAVAAMGVAAKTNMLVVLLQIGLCAGIQPLIGYNYGAKNYKRLNQVVKFTGICAVIMGSILTVVIFFAKRFMITAFINDENVVAIGTQIVIALQLSGPFIGILFLCINVLQGMGKAIPSLILTFCRQGLIFMPLVFILDAAFKLEGVIYAQPIADYASIIIACFLCFMTLGKAEKNSNAGKKIKIISTILMVLCISYSFNMQTFAKTDFTRTIKMAYPTGDGNKVEMEGYVKEFLNKLSEYTCWKIDYVPLGDITHEDAVQKVKEMLIADEVDMVGGIVKNSDNEKKYVFSEENYCTVYTTLYALEDSSITEYNYKQGTEPLRVAINKNAAARNEEVTAYLQSSDSSYELIECNSVEEQLQALKEQRADVMSGCSSSPIPNCRLVASFAPRAHYMVFAKGKEKLAEEFDEGTKKLITSQPFYMDYLAEKYFEKENITFDADNISKDILPSDGVINVLGFDDDAPFFFIDKNGNPAGFLYDILTGFAKATGQQIKFYMESDLQDCVESHAHDNFDFIVGNPITAEECVEMGFVHSTAVVTESLSELYRTGYDLSSNNPVTAVVYGSTDDVAVPNEQIKIVNTAKDAIKAVEKGNADVAYIVNSVATYYLRETESALESNTLYNTDVGITVAMNQKLNIDYMSLFNRYVRSISGEQKSLMLQNAVRHAEPNLMKQFAKQHPVMMLLSVITIIGVLILVIALLYYSKKEEEHAESLERINVNLEEYKNMLESISDGYQVVWKLNLFTGQYYVIKTPVDECQGKSGPLCEETLEQAMNDLGIRPEQKLGREFMDYKTMQKRLTDSDYLFMEVKNNVKKWRRLELFVSARKDHKPEIVLLTVRIIDDEKQKEEQLVQARQKLAAQIESGREWEYRAEHDSLTGLLNRTAYDRIAKKISELNIPVGFVIIDVDHFKEINDDYGHDIGDCLLKKAADSLLKHTRGDDYVFRYGGDEFVIIFCDTDVQNAQFIAKRIHEMAEQMAVAENEIPSVTLSAGIYFSSHGVDNAIYRYADAALYHTKQNGRAGCTVFDENHHVLFEQHESLSVQVPMAKNKLLNEISTGTWRIEMPEKGAPRMYCDEAMLKLLGVHHYLTPEECYHQWFDRIDPEHVPYVLEAVEKILETGHAEIIYPWHHPETGVMTVRCGGTFDAYFKGGKCIYGTHQDISNVAIVMKKDDSHYIVDALNEVYFCNFYIDLAKQTYTAYKLTEKLQKLLKTKDSTEILKNILLQKVVSEENYDEMKNFLTLSDIQERIAKKHYVECEYASKLTHQWCRARIVPAKWDSNGNLTHVLFVVTYIDTEKRIEWERQEQLAAIRVVNQMLFHSSQTFLGVVDLETEQLQIMVNNETELPFSSNQEYAYESALAYALKHTIVPSDRERYKNGISLKNIQQKLENSERFDFTVNRVKPDKTTGLFAYHFCYYDGDRKRLICMAEDITDQEETDVITEELTMQGFLRKAEYMLHNIPGDYAMLHLDIKGFKAINDQVGFERGNNILKEISSSIKNSSLKPLIITRDMADHFYVLIKNENIDYKEIIRLCSQHIVVENASVMTNMNCGVYLIDDKTTPIRYMCDKARMAENAVNESEGKIPYFVFTDQMKQDYLRQQEIIASLDDAVKNKEFNVYFQPVYDAKTKQIVSAEALVRWIKSDGQIISPDTFIPILEENGQISRIDSIISFYVQKFLTERYRNKEFFVPISVNLSRIDLYNNEMMEQLLNSVKTAEIPKEYLRFEITESAYSEIPENGAETINMLRDYGAKILIDDFGKGYSSLGSLTEQKFDIVKLDMSFVRQIGRNDRAEAVIRASIEMAHMMNAAVIAEGVETNEQYEFLRDNNCDYIQGYYFSKPLPREEFESLL